MLAPGAENSFYFRGDSAYRGGPIGRALGEEADSADIQDCADHVLRKESRRTSRFSSFTTEVAVARKFTAAMDNRDVHKVSVAELRQLQSTGSIRIFSPEIVYNELLAAGCKLARQAADVRAAMLRNKELLIEGQIPAVVIQRVN